MAQIKKSPDELRTCLTPEQYKITQEKGTEQAFTGKYYNNKENGMYLCVVCGQPLFSSEAKFDSGTGWPSFFQPTNGESVTAHQDSSHGMARTEVVCSACEAHLGHVFPDGPNPTGQRYCINSLALDFQPASEKKSEEKSEEKAEEKKSG